MPRSRPREPAGSVTAHRGGCSVPSSLRLPPAAAGAGVPSIIARLADHARVNEGAAIEIGENQDDRHRGQQDDPRDHR